VNDAMRARAPRRGGLAAKPALDPGAAMTGLLLAAPSRLPAVRIGLGSRCCFASCGRACGAGPSWFDQGAGKKV
jgi:hypothetical protein